MANTNGFERLDRIERSIERLAERMDYMIEHHDREFKFLLRWQVATQSQIDDMLRAQKGFDERVDKLVVAIGEMIKARVRGFALRNDLARVSEPRGPGAMVAFDIVTGSGAPDGAGAKAVAASALEHGLVLLTCGKYGETLRVLVPLTASDEIVEEGLGLLEQALGAVGAQ